MNATENGTATKPIQHSMKFKVVTMTPTWAAELLEHNHPDNRRPKPARIEQFARDMRSGLWELTHQGIAVDQDGWLIDGQNRLMAVIDADEAVPMLLVTGVPRKAMVAADYVATRSAADSARILGQPFGVNENAWASTARYMMFGFNERKQKSQASHQEILNFVKSHKEALDFAFDLLSQNKRGLCSSPMRAVIARAWYRRNSRTRIRLFCEYLMSGLVDNRKTDSSVIRLRNWLQDLSSRGQSGGANIRFQTYAKTEEALTLFINQEECERLGQARQEMFPIPGDIAFEEDDAA